MLVNFNMIFDEVRGASRSHSTSSGEDLQRRNSQKDIKIINNLSVVRVQVGLNIKKMKKKYVILFAFFLATMFTNCRKAALISTEKCLDRIEGVSEAAQLYASDPTVNNCKKYLDALKKYIDSDACFGNILFDQYGQTLQELEDAECE